MANKNTNPGIGKTADSGVMHNPQSSRAHTRTRVVSPTGILKESLTVLPGVHAREGVRTREGSAAADCRSAGGQSWRESVRTRDDANFSAWRVKTFGGNFDPVHEAVEDAVAEFSDRQASRDLRIWAWYCRHFDRRRIVDRAYFYASCERCGEIRNAITAFQNWLQEEFGAKGGAA